MESQFFLVSEAARKLSVAASTLRKFADRQKLGGRTEGGMRIFSNDDLVKFQARRAEKKNK